MSLKSTKPWGLLGGIMKTFYALDISLGGGIHLFDSKKTRDKYCANDNFMTEAITREHYDFLTSPAHCHKRGGAYRIFDHRENK